MADANDVPHVRVSNPIPHQTRVRLAAIVCAAAILIPISASTVGIAQATPASSAAPAIQLPGQVVDAKGTPIAGAHIRDAAGNLLGTTDASRMDKMLAIAREIYK